MTLCSSPQNKACRRQLMLAAVAASVLLLTTPQAARAEDGKPAREMAGELMAGKDGKQLPPVSEADLAKAKADVEKLRGMSQAERVDYMINKRENASPADFGKHKDEMRARRAYIKSLPEDQRKALKEQMKEDRKLVKEKMKAKWDAMSPEEREAAKAKRKAEFDKLPDDVKAKIKERREHMKDKKDGDHKGHGEFGDNDDHKPSPPVDGEDDDLPPPPPSDQ